MVHMQLLINSLVTIESLSNNIHFSSFIIWYQIFPQGKVCYGPCNRFPLCLVDEALLNLHLLPSFSAIFVAQFATFFVDFVKKLCVLLRYWVLIHSIFTFLNLWFIFFFLIPFSPLLHPLFLMARNNNQQQQSDSESAYYVHPSEGPNFVVVSPKFNGSNYLASSRSM